MLILVLRKQRREHPGLQASLGKLVSLSKRRKEEREGGKERGGKGDKEGEGGDIGG